MIWSYLLGFAGFSFGLCFFYKYQTSLKREKSKIEDLESLAATFDDIIMMFSKDLVCLQVLCNDESKLLRPKHENVGLTLSEMVPTKTYELTMEHIQNVNQTKLRDEFEYEFPIPNHTHWRCRITPVLDKSNRVTKYVFILSDITENWKLRQELENKKVRMLQTSKMITLGEMAACVAHEVNNPLAIINLKAEKIIQLNTAGRLNNQDLVNELRKIQETGLRIEKIIKSLRFISRNSTLDPKTLHNLFEIIDDTLGLIRERLDSNSVRIQVECSTDSPIYCRPSEIGQVFINLIGNSIDAITGQSQPWIKISVSSDSQTLKIVIADSGEKIPHQIIPRIMEPFFTTKEVGKGTGLGLSVSKTIVEGHGGRIYYDTKAQYNQFVVEIPTTSK